jgi:hypothetical protein
MYNPEGFKMKLLRTYGLFISFLFIGFTNLHAQEMEKLLIHGFGGWATGFSNNSNRFIFSSEDGEYNNYYFSMNITAQPAENLSIHSQLFWSRELNESMVDLDYMFAQYSFFSQLRFRIGKIKSPLGLYSEIYDVGTLRPFYLLPVGMYNGPGMFPKSYVGFGFTGEFLIGDNWTLNYDLIAGEIDFQNFNLEIPTGFDPITHMPIMGKVDFTPIGREMAGFKISVNTPLNGLNFGLAYLNFDPYFFKNNGPRERDEVNVNDRLNMVAGHLDYLTDNISLRSEIYHVAKDMEITGGYFEAAYIFFQKWQFAASYDWFKNETESTQSQTLVNSIMDHKNIGLGFNYWFNLNLVFKIGYYQIEGNGFAQPVLLHETFFAGNLKEKTKVVIIGTQFSF